MIRLAVLAAVALSLMPSFAAARAPLGNESSMTTRAPAPEDKAPASKKSPARTVTAPKGDGKRGAPVAARAPGTDKVAAVPSPSSPTPTTAVHEIGQGETLGFIAKKYGVPVSSLVIVNKLRGSRARLSIGQRLTIPQRPGAAATVRPRRAIDEPLPVSLVLGVPDFEVLPEFRWPVEGVVSSTFGRRRRSWHRGLDIRAESGTPIIAAAPGVVIASGWEPRYGQRVTIEHHGGFVTLYAHNQRNVVDVGQPVEAGQLIAMVGRTGHATGDHVHFEIRYDGRVYNPLYLLPLPPRTVQLDLTETDQAHDDE